MQTNEVKINDSNLLRWKVTEPKLKLLFAWLDKHAEQIIPIPEKEE